MLRPLILPACALLALGPSCGGAPAAPSTSAAVVVIPPAPPAASIAPVSEVDAAARQALSGAIRFPGERLHAPLDLVVHVDDQGFTLTTSSGPIAPGCVGLGAGTTIPRVNGEPDFKRLTVCARRLKSARPELRDEGDVGIAASAGIPYALVIKTMDALRDEGGEPLFPDVRFEMPK